MARLLPDVWLLACASNELSCGGVRRWGGVRKPAGGDTRGIPPLDVAAVAAGECSELEKEPEDIGDALATPNGD
jgi:hypothetical protein